MLKFDDLMESLTALKEHLDGKQTLKTETLERLAPLIIINAEEIKEIRTSLNLSQSVVVHKLHTSIRTYQAWEQGKTQCTSNFIIKTSKKRTSVIYLNSRYLKI